MKKFNDFLLDYNYYISNGQQYRLSRTTKTVHNWTNQRLLKARQEAIKWIKNLQGPDSFYPVILDSLPDTMKGELAKDKWNDTMFRYGSEYGMIAWIKFFFNISDEELK